LSKTQCRRLQKLRKKGIEVRKAEEARDDWFNKARPMTVPKQTWREKRLARKELSDSEVSDEGQEVLVAMLR
jgi:hypothetical protein